MTHRCRNRDCQDCNPCDYAPCFPDRQCNFPCDCSCHLSGPGPAWAWPWTVALLLLLGAWAVWFVTSGAVRP